MTSHLSAGAAKVLYKSLEDRQSFVKSKEWTVKHPHLLRLEEWTRKKIAGPPSNRADGLILHSKAFNGKTSILKYLRAVYGPHFDDKDSTYPQQPVIYVLADPVMKPNDLRISILSDILPPELVRITDAAVKKQLRVVLPAISARVLMIDELHDIMVGARRQKELYLQTIKMLSNEFGLHILGAGKSTLKDLLANEDQLNTRFSVVELPLWHVDPSNLSNTTAFKELVNAVVRNMPFPEPSTLTEDDGLNTILAMTKEGLLGLIFRTIIEGSLLALDEGAEALTEDHVVRGQALRLGGLFALQDGAA